MINWTKRQFYVLVNNSTSTLKNQKHESVGVFYNKCYFGLSMEMGYYLLLLFIENQQMKNENVILSFSMHFYRWTSLLIKFSNNSEFDLKLPFKNQSIAFNGAHKHYKERKIWTWNGSSFTCNLSRLNQCFGRHCINSTNFHYCEWNFKYRIFTIFHHFNEPTNPLHELMIDK